MVARMPPSAKDIIGLLSKLKAQTPEYPTNMLAARKDAFIKQAATLRIQGKGQGGEGGEQGGSSGSSGPAGSALGGTTTAQGIVLQALVGFGLVATMLAGMLTGDYLVRDLRENSSEDRTVPATDSPDVGSLTAPVIPTEDVPLTTTPEIIVTVEGTPPAVVINVEDDIDLLKDLHKDKKDNPGLHLGLAPGTPAAPGQGNPFNINKPEKTEKPDKPEKPNNQGNEK